MCTKYPEIIITSPKEPAAFYAVPQTVQENLLTTNYEQWCALYSMDDDDINLSYVSSNLQKHKQQQYYEDDCQYGEEYKYEYEFDDFEDDDFFDKYQQPVQRHTLDCEFNSYNQTHAQKYEGYDNKEYNDYNDYYEEDNEGFDSECDYEYDRDYDDEEIFYMEKDPSPPVRRPRLNIDILANAISRRFNNSDSDVSEESEDEFEKENAIETKIVVKKAPSIKMPSNSLKNHHDFFQKDMIRDEDNGMMDYMETIKNKYSQKELSSSVPTTKSGFSIMNDIINEGCTFGMPEAMSNKHEARSNILTHRKCNSLQGSILEKSLNGNISSILIKDSGIILNGPMKNRKRAFSLNEKNEFRALKSYMNNNKSEFNDLKKSLRFCF